MRPTNSYIRRRVRALFWLAWPACITFGIGAATLFACSDDATSATPTNAGTDASLDGTSTTKDGETEQEDGNAGGTDAGLADAKKDAKTAKDANGPLEAGAECAFNRECQAALRCECTESTGCACKVGVRGTGQNGIDACDSGEQCASSVCVESATKDVYLCSDECIDANDCQPGLPKCVPTFGFPSPICVREPPK